jgi:3-deoxy-D-arabino-heptulosonate 7-phosphate (DAHP) synthase
MTNTPDILKKIITRKEAEVAECKKNISEKQMLDAAYNFEVGINQPFFLIAGPCVIESETLALETATYLQQVTEDLGINFIYKSSYDKANRTSTSSFRGLGLAYILNEVGLTHQKCRGLHHIYHAGDFIEWRVFVHIG